MRSAALPYFAHPLTRSILRRALWVVLALVHVAPLLTVTAAALSPTPAPGGGVFLSLLALCAALLFFVLKALDVRALRWKLNRAQSMSLVLGIALIHQDLSADDGAALMLSEAPAALAAAAIVEAAKRRARLSPRLRDLFSTFASHIVLPAHGHTLEVRLAGIPASHVLSGPRLSRAPPI